MPNWGWLGGGTSDLEDGADGSARGGSPVTAPNVPRASSGDGVDVSGGHRDAELGVAGGGDLLHAVVDVVGDEEVAHGVGGDPFRVPQAGRESRAAVTGVEEGLAVARVGRDVGRRGRDLADAVVPGVGDVHVRGTVEGDLVWLVEQGRGGRAAVAGVAVKP